MNVGTLPECCRDCEYQLICFRECPKNRFVRSTRVEHGLSYFCRRWKQVNRKLKLT
jgi:uncharacterized protein